MKAVHPLFTVPDWLDSPVPILCAKRSKYKHVLNCIVLVVYVILNWRSGERDTILGHKHFPWLAVSLIFAALLVVVEDPHFKTHKSIMVGSYLNVIFAIRLIFVSFLLQTEDGFNHFLDLDSFIIDSFQFIYWCTSGFSPHSVVHTCLFEFFFLVMRVIFWREKYGSSFLPWQVNLACALVISVHLVVYCYVFCATLYFRLVTAAATKLRNYISTYTFHKNTSLHLMCILMPPLVKEIMETAALHNESPNYRRESNVKRVVGAAHQVLLLPRAVEMHLRIEWNLLQFHVNNLIDLQILIDGIIDRLPSGEGDYKSQHLYAHKNQIKTRNCDKLVYCNMKYLTFVLEAALSYSLAVNRRKKAESKGKQKNKPKTVCPVTFQSAKIAADLALTPDPSEGKVNFKNTIQHVKIRAATHLLTFHISFGGKPDTDLNAQDFRAVNLCPIMFEKESKVAVGFPVHGNVVHEETTVFKASLTLSAVKKVLEAAGGSLSITEHHDLKNEGHSIHVITMSIPCCQYTPTEGLKTADDDREGGGVMFNSRGSAINARDVVKSSRQMIDFGMDTLRDNLYDRTVEVCDLFGVMVKRVPEFTGRAIININLYHVIFTCSDRRALELRQLGYRGKLVLVSTDTTVNPNSSPVGIAHVLQYPFRLDMLDELFQTLSQQWILSTQPQPLTTVVRIQFALQPHNHIPLVSWATLALRYFSSLFVVRSISTSTEPMGAVFEKYPSTSAYTPIRAARTGVAPENVDLEYLMNNKIIVSTLSQESIRIADNHVDEAMYPKLTAAIMPGYNNWRVLNVFWVTEHDFKPRLPHLVSRRYFQAATLLNVYPYVSIVFFKLCAFLIFTASEEMFNTPFNIIYGCWNMLAILLLLLLRQRPHSVLYLIAVLSLMQVDIFRLLFEVDPDGTVRCSYSAERHSMGSGMSKERFGTFSGIELFFCCGLNPLLMISLWTIHIIYIKYMRLCWISSIIFVCMAVHLVMGPYASSIGSMFIVIMFPIATGTEFKKGEHCHLTLYMYYSKAMYTQRYLARIVHLFQTELRYPLKVLLDAQNDYFLLCLDEIVRGEVCLTGKLMREMAKYRRTLLYLREIQKHFSTQVNLGIDVDCQCFKELDKSTVSAVTPLQCLPGRRLQSFNLIEEVIELCRCFESETSPPLKVFFKICPTVPVFVHMDKELLVTFLVNVMFQSVSNIRSYAQVRAKSSDRVHEIVVLISKCKNVENPSSRRHMMDLRHDDFLKVTVLDTGLNSVLEEGGFLTGECFNYTDNSEISFGYGKVSSLVDDNVDREITATVYVQLQEFLYRASVQMVGGSFSRRSGERKHSSYLNDVSVSLPMYNNCRAVSLKPAEPSLTSAAYMTAMEYSHYRDVAAYHKIIFAKLEWRWQSLVQKLADKANCGPLCLNISPEDASNNFLGYRVSTGEGRYDNNSLSKRCFKKYATDASIYSRQVLLVVTAQEDDDGIMAESFRLQGWECTVVTSFEMLLTFSFRILRQYDVILVTNEFNRRCAVKGCKEMQDLHESLFFNYSSLYIPFVVCLVSSIADEEVLMKPCHWTAERPFVDSVIDTIVLESDKYALKKLLY